MKIIPITMVPYELLFIGARVVYINNVYLVRIGRVKLNEIGFIKTKHKNCFTVKWGNFHQSTHHYNHTCLYLLHNKCKKLQKIWKAAGMVIID